MSKHNRLVAAILILSFALGMLALFMPDNVFGQMTIPTRTPVPGGGGGGGGGDNGGGGGGDNNGGGSGDNSNNPTATSEGGGTTNPQPTREATATVPAAQPSLTATTVSVPAATSTGTATATPFAVIPDELTSTPAASPTVEYRVEGLVIVAFPENSTSFTEAEPCGMPPTFTTSVETSATGGPSEAYPIVGLLGAGEVRPIIGRAAFTDWWVVQLDASGRMGWVSDLNGVVNGFTNRVSIVSAPALDGVVPTPGGDPWLPTPSPQCDAAELAVGAVADAPASGDFSPPSNEPQLPPVELERADEGELALTLEEGGESTDQLLEELAAAAPPLDENSSGTRLPNLMPVAGAVLIIAAIFVGLFAKRARTSTPGQDEA